MKSPSNHVLHQLVKEMKYPMWVDIPLLWFPITSLYTNKV